MRFRRLLTTGAATGATIGMVAAASLSLPAVTGWAAATDTVVIHTADSADADDNNGIGAIYADGTTVTPLVEPAGTHFDEVDAAPVGEAIAYTKYVGTAITLYVDNRQHTKPHALYTAHLVGSLFDVPYYPSFSPDGRTILFTVFAYDAGNHPQATHLETVPVTGGASTALTNSGGLFDASFHPTDPTQIAASRWAGNEAALLGQLSGSTLTTTAVPDATLTDFVHFSPDGTHLAFTSQDGGALSITGLDGTVLTTVTGTGIGHVVWLDTASVLFTMAPVGSTAAGIFQLDIGATDPQPLTTTEDNFSSLATPRAADPAPTAVTRLTATLNGDHPILTWIPPIDGDVTDIVVRRAVGTTPPATVTDGEDVAGDNGTGVADTATLGETYSYSVFAVDEAGQPSPAASVTVQALGRPALSVPALAWPTETIARIPVSWGAGDAAGASYLVEWGTGAAPTSWHILRRHTTSTSAVFGSGASTRGSTYSIRVRALDAFGNATATTTRTLLIPQDDTTATFGRSWSRTSSTNYWGHSERVTRTAGAAVTKRFTGRKVQVLGDTCATCGSVKVYVDSHYRGTISARAGATHHRQVLGTFGVAGSHSHTIRLVNAPVRGRPQLRIDAFAVTG